MFLLISSPLLLQSHILLSVLVISVDEADPIGLFFLINLSLLSAVSLGKSAIAHSPFSHLIVILVYFFMV